MSHYSCCENIVLSPCCAQHVCIRGLWWSQHSVFQPSGLGGPDWSPECVRLSKPPLGYISVGFHDLPVPLANGNKVNSQLCGGTGPWGRAGTLNLLRGHHKKCICEPLFTLDESQGIKGKVVKIHLRKEADCAL